jgi:hypothetical protein
MVGHGVTQNRCIAEKKRNKCSVLFLSLDQFDMMLTYYRHLKKSLELHDKDISRVKKV